MLLDVHVAGAVEVEEMEVVLVEGGELGVGKAGEVRVERVVAVDELVNPSVREDRVVMEWDEQEVHHVAETLSLELHRAEP